MMETTTSDDIRQQSTDYRHQHFFLEAVRKGDMSQLRRLLDELRANVDVNVYNCDGQTAIHQSCYNPLKPSVVRWLHIKCSMPCRRNLPFSIYDIRALWRSGLSARVPECQKLKMVGYVCIGIV